jgi:hypothetical protein
LGLGLFVVVFERVFLSDGSTAFVDLGGIYFVCNLTQQFDWVCDLRLLLGAELDTGSNLMTVSLFNDLESPGSLWGRLEPGVSDA